MTGTGFRVVCSTNRTGATVAVGNSNGIDGFSYTYPCCFGGIYVG